MRSVGTAIAIKQFIDTYRTIIGAGDNEENFMKRTIFTLLTLTLILTGIATTNSFAQGTPSRTVIRQNETLLVRIDTKIDILKGEAERYDQRTNNNGSSDTFTDRLTALGQSTTKMQETLSDRQSVTSDLRDVMANATLVDQFISQNRVNATVKSQWASLKTDLNSLATNNGLSWNWNQTIRNPPIGTNTPSYTGTVSQMRTLVSRIAMKTGIYRSQMVTALRIDRTADVSDQEVTNNILRFETAVNGLNQNFNSRRGESADPTEVMTSATYLDQFMERNTLSSSSEAQWRNLRSDLNLLGNAYSLSWDWNQNLNNTGGGIGTGQGTKFDTLLTGTYRLNARLSEDTATVVNRAIGSSNSNDRETRRNNLERRLRSPEMIAIDVRGQTVTMASSTQAEVTFQADGVAREETNPRGRSTTTTATVDSDGLIINYQGERANDFYLTFMPTTDGKLKVTRKIYLENQEITVSSTYDKTDRVARFSTVNNGSMNGGNGGTGETFTVPVGTRLTAELSTAISTGSESFTMEVTSPGQYRRAVISGRVIAEENNTRVRGSSRVMLVFETIRLANGQTHRFASTVDSVTAVNGEIVQVTNQTANTRTTTQPARGGILGALIGAIAGVPVDSDVNSSTSAGAVLVRRGDSFELASGTAIVLRATNQ